MRAVVYLSQELRPCKSSLKTEVRVYCICHKEKGMEGKGIDIIGFRGLRLEGLIS